METEYACPHCHKELVFDNLLTLPMEYSCDYCKGEFTFAVVPKNTFVGSHNGVEFRISNAADIALWIAQAKKIHAIKELRAQSGRRLKETKQYIDRYMPMEAPDDFDYRSAANKFISDHTISDFLSKDEMSI